MDSIETLTATTAALMACVRALAYTHTNPVFFRAQLVRYAELQKAVLLASQLPEDALTFYDQMVSDLANLPPTPAGEAPTRS